MAVAEPHARGGAPTIGRKGRASRARILASAVEVSRRAGLDALSFGGVAEAAGLSKSAVVRHFGARAVSGPSAWRRILRESIEDTVALGQVDPSVEAEQASFELTGAALVYCQAVATPGDEAAKARAWRAFERTLPAPPAAPPHEQT